MSNELSVDEQQILEQVTIYIAKELSEGKKNDDIVKELVKQGWPKETASNFVAETKSAIDDYKHTPEGRIIMLSAAKRHMLYGLMWCGGGSLITYLTYSAASEGGLFLVFWGAILWGIIDFFRGLLNWYKYKD